MKIDDSDLGKKTDYPDLKRLPDHNHLKHFINWLWNKPKWLLEDLYEKYFLKQKIELEEAKLELAKKELELTLLRNEIQELSVQSKTILKIIK